MSTTENHIQADIIKELEQIFEPEIILKNDPNYIQGVPDLLMVKNGFCFWLEVKQNRRSPYQPNQEWYLAHLNRYSFAATIHPENKEEVYAEIRSALSVGGRPCLSLSE